MHATLSDLMTELVQNSVEASATEIELNVRETAEWFEFEVKDNGKGMSIETQSKAIDPFYSDGKHAHRRFGLGLPFLFQTAESSEGKASVESQAGRGSVIRFCAKAQHVDLPPLGDFAGAAAMMLTMPPEGEVKITRELNGECYTLSRRELKDALGELYSAGNLSLVRTYAVSQETNLRKAG